MTRARVLSVALLCMLPVALASCARPPGPDAPGGVGTAPSGPAAPSRPAPGRNLVEDGYRGRFRVVATVLESPDHGPQLCGAVMDSLPPQCGGPDIVGWDWKAVKAESVNGTTWGSFLVTGTWDEAKDRFTLTEPAVVPEAAKPADLPAPEPMADFRSPCPTPPGGWRAIDPARATYDAQDRAFTVARAQSDYAGAWIDQSYLSPTAPPEEANDPTRIVLNVRFTGDLARHEAELRRVWGGALCVSGAKRSMADLERIRSEVEPGIDRMVSSSVSDLDNTVTFEVVLARAEQQRDLDTRYGAGAVVLTGWLAPID